MDYNNEPNETKSEPYGSSLFQFGIDHTSGTHFLGLANWSKWLGVLSILSVVFLGGFLIISAVENIAAYEAAGLDGSSFTSGTIIVIAVFVALYIYPVYAMLRFGSLMRRAIGVGDQEVFNHAVRTLLGLFRYTGILMLLAVIFYAVAIFGKLFG